MIGATAFFVEVVGDQAPRNSILWASLLLMGVPVVNRVFGKNGNGEPKD